MDEPKEFLEEKYKYGVPTPGWSMARLYLDGRTATNNDPLMQVSVKPIPPNQDEPDEDAKMKEAAMLRDKILKEGKTIVAIDNEIEQFRISVDKARELLAMIKPTEDEASEEKESEELQQYEANVHPGPPDVDLWSKGVSSIKCDHRGIYINDEPEVTEYVKKIRHIMAVLIELEDEIKAKGDYYVK